MIIYTMPVLLLSILCVHLRPLMPGRHFSKHASTTGIQMQAKTLELSYEAKSLHVSFLFLFLKHPKFSTLFTYSSYSLIEILTNTCKGKLYVSF